MVCHCEPSHRNYSGKVGFPSMWQIAFVAVAVDSEELINQLLNLNKNGNSNNKNKKVANDISVSPLRSGPEQIQITLSHTDSS